MEMNTTETAPIKSMMLNSTNGQTTTRPGIDGHEDCAVEQTSAALVVRQVARGGIEPPTYRFSVGRSYQLSYLAVASRPGATLSQLAANARFPDDFAPWYLLDSGG